MRRMILAAMAVVAVTMTVPAPTSAQEVREQRRAELRQRIAQRRAEVRQRVELRRPELKQRLTERRLLGQRVKVRPMVRKQLVERRLRANRPELFDRLDLNKDGQLSRDEFAQRFRRR